MSLWFLSCDSKSKNDKEKVATLGSTGIRSTDQLVAGETTYKSYISLPGTHQGHAPREVYARDMCGHRRCCARAVSSLPQALPSRHHGLSPSSAPSDSSSQLRVTKFPVATPQLCGKLVSLSPGHLDALQGAGT